jgi:hypothetical protein
VAEVPAVRRLAGEPVEEVEVGAAGAEA